MAAQIVSLNVSVGIGDVTTSAGNIAGYLGFGGREFCLNASGVQDFTANSSFTYVYGQGSNIEKSDLNDPRQITDEDSDLYSRYIRLELSTPGFVKLTSLSVEAIFSDNTSKTYKSTLLPVQLSDASGREVYLKKE